MTSHAEVIGTWQCCDLTFAPTWRHKKDIVASFEQNVAEWSDKALRKLHESSMPSCLQQCNVVSGPQPKSTSSAFLQHKIQRAASDARTWDAVNDILTLTDCSAVCRLAFCLRRSDLMNPVMPTKEWGHIFLWWHMEDPYMFFYILLKQKEEMNEYSTLIPPLDGNLIPLEYVITWPYKKRFKFSLIQCWPLFLNVSLPVMIAPIKMNIHRKIFPAKVPHLSIIFPWAMVKMIPKIWKQIGDMVKLFRVNLLHTSEWTCANLSWTVEKTRWSPFWFWVGEFYCKLKAQRKVSSHEEAAETHSR